VILITSEDARISIKIHGKGIIEIAGYIDKRFSKSFCKASFDSLLFSEKASIRKKWHKKCKKQKDSKNNGDIKDIIRGRVPKKKSREKIPTYIFT